jgi:hypothetical protein
MKKFLASRRLTGTLRTTSPAPRERFEVDRYRSAFYSGNVEGTGASLAKDLHCTGPVPAAHAAKAPRGHEVKKVFIAWR